MSAGSQFRAFPTEATVDRLVTDVDAVGDSIDAGPVAPEEDDVQVSNQFALVDADLAQKMDVYADRLANSSKRCS